VVKKAALFLLSLSLAAEARPEESLPVLADEKHRGVSWVAGREVTSEDLAQLEHFHVNWIVQTPFGWQRSHSSPEVALATGGRVYWGERDVGLEATTRLARKLGIRTLLKPHIWLTRAGGKWRSDIEMGRKEDWDRWFSSYRQFILHYARLAERLGIEALAIGTELRRTVLARPEEWRRIIREVRSIYRGELLYAANWYREFEEFPLWGELDYIGIQAYFPLSEREGPSLEELKRGWESHLPAIERVQKRIGKPVLFTEIGYKSSPDSAVDPWVWPRSSDATRKVDLETQARAYRAFFESVWDKHWLAGAYFWKWYPKARPDSDPVNIDFTPQGKPAQKILADWYGRTSAQ
jgi:hypothetical protein